MKNSLWKSAGRGFSLVELLVAMAVTSLLMLLVFQIIASVSATWQRGTGQAGAFASARASIEAVTRQLSQATLATYLAYADQSGNPVPLVNPSFRGTEASLARDRVPSQYLPASELHFLSGPAASIFNNAGVSGVNSPGHAVFFQAPLGHVLFASNRPKSSLLNSVGFFVEYGSDEAWMPAPLQSNGNRRFRYRLMQVVQPAEENMIYRSTVQTNPSTGLPEFQYDTDWIAAMNPGAGSRTKSPLAENIIAFALLPRLSSYRNSDPAALSPNYVYDSRAWEAGAPVVGDPRWRNQLPPVVEVICVAIDEPSALRLQERFGGGGSPPLEHGAVRAAVDFSTLFLNAAELENDLAKVENGLSQLGIAYRIFRTQLTMRGAQWSN